MDVSFQLYSGRNAGPIEPLLGRLASLGYTQVEGFGGVYADPVGFAASLKANGLAMTTAHVQLEQLKDVSATITLAEALGVKTLFCPSVPQAERGQDEGRWVALADTLAALGDTYRKAGFGFGWHNHAFEFVPTASGKLPMNIILDAAPENVWEVDVAWLVKAGLDPLDWFRAYGRQITAIHVKDIAPKGEALAEDGWADVGHGTLDWQALYDALKANARVEYYVMEHDNPSDVDRFARRSIAAVRAWK